MNKWILLVCSFLITNVLHAQLQRNFQKTYGGKNTGDFAESVIETADGHFVFAGTTANSDGRGFDLFLVKTDREGNEIWSQAYGSLSNEVGIGVRELADRSLICVGNTNALLNTPQILGVKTDADGNEVWSKILGDLNANANDLVVASDGGIVIAGGRNGNPYLLKIDEEGILQWDNTLAFGGPESLVSVSETGDMGFVVSATTNTGLGTEMILIKTDNEGDFEWSNQVPEREDASRLEARDAVLTSDGGYVMMGKVRGGSNGIFVHKVSGQGDDLWSQQYFIEGDNIEPLRMAESTADSSLFIVGEGLLDNSDFEEDVFALKLDKQGMEVFQTTYTYGGFEVGNAILNTSDGDMLIAGMTDSFNGSGNDVLSLRISADSGDEMAQQSYGEVGNADSDRGSAVFQTSDSGYLITGHSNSFNERGDTDLYLLKLDVDGELEWTKTLDFFNGVDGNYNMVQANNGDFGLYGVSQIEEGALVFQLTRIDEDGDVIWTRIFDNLLNVFTKGISALDDNGFVVCGRLSTGGVYYAKIDSDGELVWENSYVGNVAYNIKPTSDGGYVLAGRANFQQDAETGVFYTPLQVVKVDENGAVVWERFMGSGASLLSRAFDVVETLSGGFVLIGSRTGATAETSNLLIAKLGDTGNVLWEKELLTEEYSFSNYVVQQTSDNGLMFVGNVGNSGDLFGRRGFLLKTDGIGNEKWIRYFGADVGVFPTLYDGMQTSDGGYAMVGSVTVDNSEDVYFVKTDELGFTEIVSIFSPTTRLHLQLAPNPNEGRFQISFEGEHIGVVELSIFDMTGRRRVFNHSAQKEALEYHQELDISDLNSGLYIVEVLSGDKRYSHELMIK